MGLVFKEATSDAGAPDAAPACAMKDPMGRSTVNVLRNSLATDLCGAGACRPTQRFTRL